MSTFNEQGFEKKLLALKDSQESISTLSDWCLQNKQHHKKIVSTWLTVLKKVRVENRLTLFYLANDVIQYSKRKNYDFVESWGTALQKATTMVRHDKVMNRILRIFKIWGERSVYNEEFLTDLRGLLTAKKATPATPQSKQSEQQASSGLTTGEFIPSNLFIRMSKCQELEDDTDLKLKVINECKLKLNDLDAFRTSLKDRRHADGVAGELDDAISQMERYKKALEVEILERKAVIDLLQQAAKFYDNEKSDAKVVFNAYRNFGSRVKSLKRKLDELIPTLASPVPSPDVNAPSPSPDSDIDLPNDDDLSGKAAQSFRKDTPLTLSASQSSDLGDVPNCFTSFMGGGTLPFDIQENLFSDDGSNRPLIVEGEPEGKPIEVIGRRKGEDNFDITRFLKNLAQGSPSTVKSTAAASIPGLGDPLPVPPPPMPSDFQLPPSSPSSVPVPPPPMPPNMFDNHSQDSREREEWNTALPPKFPTWRDTAESNWAREDSNAQDGGEWMPALPVPKVPPPPLPQSLETPESPPSFEKEPFREPVEYDDTGLNRSSIMSGDVDHRSFMGHSSTSKDVDHRILNNRFKKDVDHRNLISLTGSPRELQPPPLPPALWGDVDQDYRTTTTPKQTRPGDIVESVDMEMSDDESERHHDKGRSREQSPAKRPQSHPESPIKERDELSKSKSPHSSTTAKLTPLPRFHLPPPSTRPPFPPPPPQPGFPEGQFRFDPPGLRPDLSNKFPVPPCPPPPMALHGPGGVLRLRHPGMNLLSNMTLPPNPLLGIPNRSPVPLPVPAPLTPQRLSETSPPHAIPTPNAQQVTPTGNSGTVSSGPEESDTDSIGQYLNMGLSDDEEIKEMVASMDPQLLQEVVDGISIGNGSDKLDLNSLMPNNGEAEESDPDWNGQSDFSDPNNRSMPSGIRPWRQPRQGGTPTGPHHPPMSPGTPRFRGQLPNWRSPQMHDRGGIPRGRGWGFRPFRGGPRGPLMPRQPYGGSW